MQTGIIDGDAGRRPPLSLIDTVQYLLSADLPDIITAFGSCSRATQ
ncbi:MAG: hypothetical protein ACLVJ6_08235 [Merdibacter sp.]